jgi:oligoribonuclease
MNSEYIVWLDLEMTGLHVESDKILEIAMIITNWDLQEVARDSWVIHHSDEVLATMIPFVTKMHTDNGLIKDIKECTANQEDVEHQICRFLVPYLRKSGRLLVGGNSVHQDRLFIEKHLPILDSLLHYRCIDATPIGLLTERWCNKQYKIIQGTFGGNNKQRRHRAINDIDKCLQWMRGFKDYIFINN